MYPASCGPRLYFQMPLFGGMSPYYGSFLPKGPQGGPQRGCEPLNSGLAHGGWGSPSGLDSRSLPPMVSLPNSQTSCGHRGDPISLSFVVR